VLSCTVTLDTCLNGRNKMAPLPSRIYHLAPRSPLPPVKLSKDAPCRHPWLAAAHSAVLKPNLTLAWTCNGVLVPGQVQRQQVGSPENYHLHPLVCAANLHSASTCHTFVPTLNTSGCRLFRFKDHRLLLSHCLHIFCRQNSILAVHM
jgi:hypothetical protein